MVDITWPPATLPLTGGELVPTLQGGKITGAPPSAFGGGGGGGGGQVAASYAAIRSASFNPTQPLILNAPNKSGLFTAGIHARDNGGTIINDAGGVSWYRVYNGFVNAQWFYNGPGFMGGDSFSAVVTITSADQAANPQWIGLPPALGGGNYPVGMTWAGVALQEATYACFASASVPGTVTWNARTVSLNLPLWLPPGQMFLNQPWYFMAEGFQITFAQRKAFLVWNGAQNVAPIQMDAISYGDMDNLSISDDVGIISQPLIDCNWTGVNAGLKVQNLTFNNLTLFGGFAQHGSVGLYIARNGNNSQGDTVVLVNPGIFFVNQGVIMGGDNALNLTVVGGNLQSQMRDGFVAYGGSFQCYNTSWQAAAVDFHVYPQSNQFTMDGADAHIYPGGGQTSRSALRDTRSENVVMSLDQNGSTRIDNASIAQAYGIGGGWGAGNHQHLGFVIATGGSINALAVLVDDGGPAWFPADPTSTNTIIVHPAPSPGWTVNQWAGYARWFRFTNGFCNAGVVLSNTANTVTDTIGWYTPNPPTVPVPPLAGYFVKIVGVTGSVEPSWDTFPTGNYTLLGAQGSPGYGFTTGVGSNVVSTLEPVSNGQYVMVCGAVGVQQPSYAKALIDGPLVGKAQNFTAGASFTASLAATGVLTVSAVASGSIKIGAVVGGGGIFAGTVIQSQTSGTPNGVGVYQVSNPTQPPVASTAMSTLPAFELVNSLGEPMNASYAITDAMGYWGAAITDGQVFWLPLDFNIIQGAASIDGLDPGAYGKFFNCGLVSINQETDLSLPFLTRYRQPQSGNGNYTLRNGSSVGQVLPGQTGNIANPTTITTAQVSDQSSAPYNNGLAAFTLNMPTWLTGVLQEFRIIINNSSAGAVLTFGTNIAASAPTVNLGASGTVTSLNFMWGIKANAWALTSVIGPL